MSDSPLKQQLNQLQQQLSAGTAVAATRVSQAPAVLSKEAVNQVFNVFRLNYHNQFFKAFPNVEEANLAKRLWFNALKHFDDNTVLQAAEQAIRQSEFLPTLHSMLQYCEQFWGEAGLPSPRNAYIEACRAGSPKLAQPWSHPVVYLAACDSDWFFLANNPEHLVLPVFEQHYRRYCARVLAGEVFTLPTAPALPDPAKKTLSRAENLARLQQMRDQLDI